MSKRLRIGDRVEDSYLGQGTVVKRLSGGWGYEVLWDRRPDVRYNMGENPCQWWPGCHDTETEAMDVSEVV